MDEPKSTLLQYLRSKTQVDLDTFDIECKGSDVRFHSLRADTEFQAARKLRGCIDCTSNQYEYYTELSKESRKDVLHKAIKLAESRHGGFPSVTMEELTVEAAAILMAIEIKEFVEGDIHVMANPRYSYSRDRIVGTGRQFGTGLHELAHFIDETFDRSRLVMKVPATWEGLQACRDLRIHDIKTLATTLFTMQQAVLAGEVRCVSISPFIHELKAMFDQSYRDKDPLLNLCVQAQQWYELKSLPTRVKACANIGLDEILQLAGVAAFTILPDDLRLLDSTHETECEIRNTSLFTELSQAHETMNYPSYIDEEAKYRIEFARADDGKAQLKLAQAITVFCDFQIKAEAIVRAAKEGVTE